MMLAGETTSVVYWWQNDILELCAGMLGVSGDSEKILCQRSLPLLRTPSLLIFFANIFIQSFVYACVSLFGYF